MTSGLKKTLVEEDWSVGVCRLGSRLLEVQTHPAALLLGPCLSLPI